MKLCLISYALLAFGLVLGASSLPEPWRGIIPLKSTRTDVEKLLGKPGPPPANGMHVYDLNNQRSIYFTEEGQIWILYARFTKCAKGVSPDAVLWVSYRPTKKMLVKELLLEESKFQNYDPAFPPGIGYKAYINETSGYSILTFNDVVEEIRYQPTAEDRKLCSEYFERGESIRFSIHTHVRED